MHLLAVEGEGTKAEMSPVPAEASELDLQEWPEGLRRERKAPRRLRAAAGSRVHTTKA